MKLIFSLTAFLYVFFLNAQNSQNYGIDENNYALGVAQLEKGSLDNALFHFSRGLELSEEQKNPTSIANGHFYMSDYYLKAKDYSESIKSAEKALTLFKVINDSQKVGDCFLRLGDLYNKKSNFDQSNYHLLEALKIKEQLGNEIEVGKVLSKIGRIYLIAPDPEINLPTARQFFEKALKIFEEHNDEEWVMKMQTSLGSIFLKQGINQSKNEKIIKAIEIFEQALIKAEQLNLKRDEATLLGNIGPSLRILDRNEESLEYLLRALEIKLGFENLTSASHSCNDISETYIAMGDLKNAEKYALRAVELAKGVSINQERYAFYLLSEINFETGKYKNAFIDLKEYHKLADSIFSKQKIETINEFQIKYETEKKSLIIQAQQSDIALLNEKDKLKNRNISLGLLGILMVFGFVLFYRSRMRDKEKQALQIQYSQDLLKSQEEERTRIARDLHDGIGQSLLLIKKQMQKSNEAASENQQMISETLEEVRSLSRDLHPFQLDKFGLTSTIEDTLQKISKSTNLFISSELINIDDLIPQQSTIHIFRTIQEAMNNIIKHSEASAAKVVFESSETGLIITIQDNGKGFDPEQKINNSTSLGLKTMHERIASIGGKFKIEKGTPKGTIISIYIPKK